MGNANRIKWDERTGAAVNARRRLPRLVADYFARVRGLLAAEPSAAKLHRLRLATKRLRYTLELFRPCYGPALESRLAALGRIQQVLGEVNDSTAAARLLAKSMSGDSPQSVRIQRFLEERVEQKAREFQKDWTEVFDAPGQEQWWIKYLARNARTPGRRASA
jgi:CHAD domain-containing protein